MKFWQYAIGGLLALLVFSAVLIADNMQFSERNSFSQNPFSLMGTSHADFGGEIQFLPSGEMLWIDDGAELVLTESKRELLSGTTVLGGTFFSTSEDTSLTNNIWLGNARLVVEGSSALIHVDAAGKALILSGGGSVELFLEGQENPFLMPSHSRMSFDIAKNISQDPSVDYYELSEKFSVAPLATGEFVTKLWQAEQALANWRSQFGHFAWNIPSLWETQNGVFLQFLERVSPTLPAGKVATREFQKVTIPLQEAHRNIEDSSANVLLEKFKTDILHSTPWKKILLKSEQAQKEWNWFEFAQKIWLPVVSPDADEQKFAVLWEDDTDLLLKQMKTINLLSHNEFWLRGEKNVTEFGAQFSQTEFTEEDVWKIVRLRREMTNILRRFSVYQSAENFDIWMTMIREEQQLLSSDVRSQLTLEAAHEILPFVALFISEENDSSITKNLNTLWFELKIPESSRADFSLQEQTTMELIDLVGVSGMTPEQARKAQAQETQRDAIAGQLESLLEETQEEEEEIVDMGISNAKKLWEFLASEHIDIDITSFRTTRTETELTTRFANTAEGKRKIEGVFDYHAQKFIMLTLGEETISDLSAHRLGRWIKNIGGKFESPSLNIEVGEKEVGIIQTSPQAILSRKLVQELLRSLGIDVPRDQIEMIDELYQKSRISKAVYQGAHLNIEYNLLTQMFSNISIQREKQILSHVGAVSGENLLQTLNQLMSTLPDKN